MMDDVLLEIERTAAKLSTAELDRSGRPLSHKLRVIAGESANAAQAFVDKYAIGAPPPRPIACAAGCAWCCTVQVGVSLADLAALLVAISTWPGEKIEELGRTVRKLAASRKRLTGAEHDSARTPCPLLDDQKRCRVYDARPLACRGYNSMSARRCESYFFSGHGQVPTYMPQLEIHRAIQRGVTAALTEKANALVGALHLELTAALDVALSLHPDHWLDPTKWREATFARALPGVYGKT